MADNLAVTPGVGAQVAADDISSVLHQRVKISLGADGSATDALGGAGSVSAGVQRVTLASDDPAVASLASILAKIIVAPATEAKQDTLIAKDFATQTTLAAVLAKIISAPATEAKQDTIITALGSGASGLGKAEDAAHTTGDRGVSALGVRRDAKASGADTDGDYATFNLSAAGDIRVDGGQAHIVRVTPTVTAGAYTADDILGGEMTIANAARISGGSGIITGITMVAEDDTANGFAVEGVEVLIFDSNPAGTYTDNAALDSSSLTDADAALLIGSVLLDTKSALGNISMLKATNVNIPYVCSGSANLFAVAINRGGVTPEATDALTFTFHLIRD